MFFGTFKNAIMRSNMLLNIFSFSSCSDLGCCGTESCWNKNIITLKLILAGKDKYFQFSCIGAKVFFLLLTGVLSFKGKGISSANYISKIPYGWLMLTSTRILLPQ